MSVCGVNCRVVSSSSVSPKFRKKEMMLSKNQTTKVLPLCQFVVNEYSGFEAAFGFVTACHPPKKDPFRRHSSTAAGIVLQSEFGSVTNPNLNLTQFVWKDFSKWADKPMVVRQIFFEKRWQWQTVGLATFSVSIFKFISRVRAKNELTFCLNFCKVFIKLCKNLKLREYFA